MNYGLYTYHKGQAKPTYRMMNTDKDYLDSMGREWKRLNQCQEYSVEVLETK